VPNFILGYQWTRRVDFGEGARGSSRLRSTASSTRALIVSRGSWRVKREGEMTEVGGSQDGTMDLDDPIVQARIFGFAISRAHRHLGLADIPDEPLVQLLDRILQASLRGGLDPVLYQVIWFIRFGSLTRH
jgi:hypothetical protein